MKKLITLLIALLLLPAIPVIGQTDACKRFSYTTNFGSGVPMSSPSQTPFTWQLMGHYHLGQRFAIGAGTGVSVYEKTLIPLYASGQFFLTKPKKLRPYFECNIGGAFTVNKDTNGGFYLSPSAGAQLPLSSKLKLNFSIGYELQKLDRIKKYTDTYFSSEFKEQLSHHTLTFKIGLTL